MKLIVSVATIAFAAQLSPMDVICYALAVTFFLRMDRASCSEHNPQGAAAHACAPMLPSAGRARGQIATAKEREREKVAAYDWTGAPLQGRLDRRGLT